MITQEEKYKLALFAVVRSSKVMLEGLELGKSMREINAMSRDVVSQIIQLLNFEELKQSWEEAGHDNSNCN